MFTSDDAFAFAFAPLFVKWMYANRFVDTALSISSKTCVTRTLSCVAHMPLASTAGSTKNCPSANEHLVYAY